MRGVRSAPSAGSCGSEQLRASPLGTRCHIPLTSFVDTTNSLITSISPTTADQDNILPIIAQVRQNSEMREQRIPITVADQPIGEVWLGYSIQSVQQQTWDVAIRTA